MESANSSRARVFAGTGVSSSSGIGIETGSLRSAPLFGEAIRRDEADVALPDFGKSVEELVDFTFDATLSLSTWARMLPLRAIISIASLASFPVISISVIFKSSRR